MFNAPERPLLAITGSCHGYLFPRELIDRQLVVAVISDISTGASNASYDELR